jgi:hypothetical protein
VRSAKRRKTATTFLAAHDDSQNATEMTAGRISTKTMNIVQAAREMNERVLIALSIVTLLIVAGCDDGRPTRVPIAGTVLVDGKPLTVGDVKFVPQGARPSSGKIDASGRFRLTCYDGGDGAVLGKHRVQVSASEIKGEDVRWHAPIKYANFRTSGITFEVNEPTESMVIELKSDGSSAEIRTNDT